MTSTRRNRCSRARANAFSPRVSSGRHCGPVAEASLDLVFASAAPQFLPYHKTPLPRLFGIAVERWLFFAQAQHVSVAFYDRAS